MLALKIKPGTGIWLETKDGPVRIVYLRHGDGAATWGIEAPKSVVVLRDALRDRQEAKAS